MINNSFSGIRADFDNSGENKRTLKFTEKKLINDVVKSIMCELDTSFKNRNLPYIEGQRESLEDAVREIISKPNGEVIVVPIVPGGGKSTLIKAILKVLSKEFYLKKGFLDIIGGVIVVVEKTADARELCKLCCEGNHPEAATVIESPNDFNLSLGECPLGEAESYDMCLRKDCPEADICPLMLASRDKQKSPIIIMLHARYNYFMNDMSSFSKWQGEDGICHSRNLLLIDEIPNLLEENRINIEAINNLETQLDELKPSYIDSLFCQKNKIFYQWSQYIRSGLLNLITIYKQKGDSTMVVGRELIEKTRLNKGNILNTMESVLRYLKDKNSLTYKFLRVLAESEYFVVSRGKTFMVTVPQAKSFDAGNGLKTVTFSGTARLSPELINNPEIKILEDRINENFSNLKISIYRSDYLHLTKAALNNNVNREVAVAWLKHLLDIYQISHEKILLVSHKEFSGYFWDRLEAYHDVLIPHIYGTDEEKSRLPYFGGVSGSNKYQAATCVICLGINLLEYGDYINRAIAFDYNNQLAEELSYCDGDINMHKDVVYLRDINIACNLVQLIYRSALRRHSEKKHVQVVLPAISEGVLKHLEESFPDCSVDEILDIPYECKTVRLTSKTCNGKIIKCGRMLEWLQLWDGEKMPTKDVRERLQFTQSQYHDALKNKLVKEYITKENIITVGKGKGACLIGKKYNSLNRVA